MATTAIRREVAVQGEDSKIKNYTLWALQIFLAVMFLNAGLPKLASQPQMVQFFDKLGFGQWFRYFTGSIEVTSALLLVLPGWAGIGALLLIATMTGAVLTHLFLIGGNPAMALMLFVIAVIVAGGRKDSIRKRFRMLWEHRPTS